MYGIILQSDQKLRLIVVRCLSDGFFSGLSGFPSTMDCWAPPHQWALHSGHYGHAMLREATRCNARCYEATQCYAMKMVPAVDISL